MATKMSKRRGSARGRNTTIEYEFSEWDADLPQEMKGRERSNSADLLQELRRSKKVHAPSQTVAARFSDHYDSHVMTVPNTAPNPTFARSFRYGKEPDKHECHDWKRKSASDTVNRGTQCAIRPGTRSATIQCKPQMREINIQTHRAFLDGVQCQTRCKDRGIQATNHTAEDYQELLMLIRGLNNRPAPPPSTESPGLPEGVLQQISASLAELMALLRTVRQTTDTIDTKETEVLSSVKGLKLTGGNGNGEALLRVASLLEEILLSVKASAKAEDTAKLLLLIEQLNKTVESLKGENQKLMLTIRGLGNNGMDEEYYIKIITYLKEILEELRVEEEEVTITRRQLYEGRCRCAEITDAANAIYKGSTTQLPGICQRCTNDINGKTFVQSLNLPVALTGEIVNLFGKAMECIERDDEFNLKLLLEECKKVVGNKWDHKTYQITNEALFHLSLLWRSEKAAIFLAGLIETNLMIRGMKNEDHRYRLPDYLNKAIKIRSLELMEVLFAPMSDQEKIMIINTPLIKDGVRRFPMFEAARVGDSELFSFFVKNGAALDVRETDKTILHELAWISKEKQQSPKLKEWNKIIVSMLGTVFDRSGHWWERQLLHAAWTGCTEASRQNALSYLFSIPDGKGRNALQFAARYATPEVIRKIVCNPPYEFIPDPLEFGHDNGLKGYVVDEIESRLARKNDSVLERMLLRDPLDGAGVLSIEPFKSMIDDKWRRYRVFYGLWFILYLCYMFVYTWVAMERPLNRTSIADMYKSGSDYARLIGEIFVLVCLPLFAYGEIRDGIRMGFVVPRPWLRTGIFRILTVIFVICTIVAVILRLLLNPNEDKPLALALLLGWILALEFLGAWKSIGMFATIMHEVVAIDVALKFLLVWLISLTGTSAATFIAYQQSPEQIQQNFPILNTSFWFTPLALTKVSLAVLDADYVTDAADPPFGVILFIIFAFLFNFLLFSLVIGMMADTYARMRIKINASWIWVKATYAMMMDRRLPSILSIKYGDNKQRGVSSLSSTKLRYLTRLSKRRIREGGLVEVKEHVVLVAQEDLPKTVTITGRDLEIISSGLIKSPIL